MRGRYERQPLVSAYIRDQNKVGIVPILTPELIRYIETTPMAKLTERGQRALEYIIQKYGYSEERRDIVDDLGLQAVSYAREFQELGPVLSILEYQGAVKYLGGAISLTPKGILDAESRSSAAPNSAQGFVAMSFDPSMATAYEEGFSRAIRDAGYDPMRIDNKEHVNGISDEIMAEIRRSRFVVTDYTDQRHGVYFEAGFAVGLGITVVPTCHVDHFKNIHFDVRHINTLKWNTPEDLRESLSKRISAVIGDGPKKGRG